MGEKKCSKIPEEYFPGREKKNTKSSRQEFAWHDLWSKKSNVSKWNWERGKEVRDNVIGIAVAQVMVLEEDYYMEFRF